MSYLERLYQHASWWDAVGWTAQLVFGLRFVVQWIQSERKQESVIPIAFWYLSIVGSLVALVYAIGILSPPLIAGYALNWIVYARNLVLIYRKERAGKVAAT